MKDKSKNRFHRSDLAVFFSFFRPHLGLFALDMSCAVAVAVIDLAFPYITRVSMQTLLPEKLYTTFFVIMAAMFAAYILKGLMYYLITVLGHRMGVYIEADMRHAVFNHMQRLSFSFFDRNRTGALMSRITSDLFEITELAHHGPEDILISVLTIIGSLIVLAGIEWRLALVLAVCLPLLILFTLSRRVSMKRANIEVKRQTAEISCSRLTKAMFEPSRRKRRAGEEVLPSEPPAASAWATAEAASSEEISTACALRRRIFPSASSVTLNVGKSASRCSLGRLRAGPINSFCASPPAACISSARSAMSFSVES